MSIINNKNISIIGLGKLGSCFATSFAYRGFRVLGLDINEKLKLNLTGKFKIKSSFYRLLDLTRPIREKLFFNKKQN